MPRKRVSKKKTQPDKPKGAERNSWAAVNETEMKGRTWSDWMHDQLKSNKIK